MYYCCGSLYCWPFLFKFLFSMWINQQPFIIRNALLTENVDQAFNITNFLGNLNAGRRIQTQVGRETWNRHIFFFCLIDWKRRSNLQYHEFLWFSLFFHIQCKFISFLIMIDYNNKCFIKKTCGQLVNLYDRSSVSSVGHVRRQLGATIALLLSYY